MQWLLSFQDEDTKAQTHRGEAMWRTEVKIRAMQPQATDHSGPRSLEEARKESSRTFEGSAALPTSSLGLLASHTVVP